MLDLHLAHPTGPFSFLITLIFLMDPFGNVPKYHHIFQKSKFKNNLLFILKEFLIGIVILYVAFFVGDYFLLSLYISTASISIGTCFILFIIAIKMIFQGLGTEDPEENRLKSFLHPIPVISGPAAIAFILVYSHHDITMFQGIISIAIASILTSLLLLFANSIYKRLGYKGVNALERLTGLILILLSAELLLEGIAIFIHTLPEYVKSL